MANLGAEVPQCEHSGYDFRLVRQPVARAIEERRLN
jgi:hypothetical protein